MGWTPAEVRACSVSDLMASFEGWRMAHVPQSNEPTLDNVDWSPEEIAKAEALAEYERVSEYRRKMH